MVVETSEDLCPVMQKVDYDSKRIKVTLTFIGKNRKKRCAITHVENPLFLSLQRQVCAVLGEDGARLHPHGDSVRLNSCPSSRTSLSKEREELAR